MSMMKRRFFYERWGDAPVHSLAVGMFLRKEQVIFFEDIGYFHNPISNCPLDAHDYYGNHCDCDRKDAVNLIDRVSCIPRWVQYQPTPYFT